MRSPHPLKDRFVGEILTAGADWADLIEAVARGGGDLLDFPAAPRPMSATVCEIIEDADAAVADLLEEQYECLHCPT